MSFKEKLGKIEKKSIIKISFLFILLIYLIFSETEEVKEETGSKLDAIRKARRKGIKKERKKKKEESFIEKKKTIQDGIETEIIDENDISEEIKFEPTPFPDFFEKFRPVEKVIKVDELGRLLSNMEKNEMIYIEPNYDIFGRGLVYNCIGKHYACIDRNQYKLCMKLHERQKEIYGKGKCLPIEVYFNLENCQKAQELIAGKSLEGKCQR